MALIRRWRLNNDATDDCGLGDGTATSMVYGPSGITPGSQYAATPNGTTSRISVPFMNWVSYTNYSISILTKMVSPGTSQDTWISEGDTGSTNGYIWFHRYYASGKIEYYVRVGGSGTIKYRDQSTAEFNDGEWHNFVVTDANGTVRVYADGVLQSDMNGSYARASVSANTTDILTIHRSSGYSSYSGDPLSDVRFYDTALTAAEVKKLYQSYFRTSAFFAGHMQ